MWYAVISEDVEDSLELRIQTRESHLERLKTLADATQWANSDPYLTAGVYQSVVVKPFRQVLP